MALTGHGLVSHLEVELTLGLTQGGSALGQRVAIVGGFDPNEPLTLLDKAAGRKALANLDDRAGDLRLEHNVLRRSHRTHRLDHRAKLPALGRRHLDQHGGLLGGTHPHRLRLGGEHEPQQPRGRAEDEQARKERTHDAQPRRRVGLV